METQATKLSGSEKQVKWASDIREKMISCLSADDAAKLLTHTDARWWIDHRFDSAKDLANPPKPIYQVSLSIGTDREFKDFDSKDEAISYAKEMLASRFAWTGAFCDVNESRGEWKNKSVLLIRVPGLVEGKTGRVSITFDGDRAIYSLPKASSAPAGSEERCRHGRLFSEVCAECDDDF